MKYIFIFLFSAVVVYGTSDKEQDRATNRLFNSLKTSAMTGQEQSQVPALISSIGGFSDQCAVLEFAQDWITPCSFFHQVETFVKVVAALTPDERQKVGRLTNSIIKKSDASNATLRAVHAPGYRYYEIGDHRSQVFCAIAALSAGEQETIVGLLNANLFIIEGMQDLNLAYLIKGIAAEKATDRESEASLVKVLMSQGIKDQGYFANAVANLPKEMQVEMFKDVRDGVYELTFPTNWQGTPVLVKKAQ